MDRHQTARGAGLSEDSSRRTNGRACVNCRQRKVRCDVSSHGTPCSNCKSHDRVDCRIYDAKQRKRRETTPSNGGRLKPLKPYNNVTAAQQSSTSTPLTRASSLGAAPEDLVEPLAEPPKEGNEASDQGNIAEFLDREDFRATEINNAARNCYVGTEVSNFNYLVRQSSIRAGNDESFHFANRQFHPSLTSYNLHRMPPDVLQRPEKSLADELIKAYFDEINRGWPIIDEEDFMVKYGGQDLHNPMPPQLLNAVFLVGAHVLATHDKSMKARQAEFFRRAKTIIDFRFEQDRISHIQAAVLLSWYSDGQEEIMANAWHWIGVACRIGLGMGLHRDTTPSRLVQVSKRTWTRLWWVLFQLDTMIASAYGRPQALNLDEADVPELDVAHFEGVPNAETDFVIQHTRLCVILSKVTKKRWALRTSVASQVEATRQADDALAHFLAQLPPKLKATASCTNVWQATLHLTYNNILILLHRPPPKQTSQGSPINVVSDASICGDAALVMTSVFESLLCQGLLSRLWLNGVHDLFTAIVHATNALNSSNPVVATKSFRMFDSLLAALRGLSRHWQFAASLLSLFEKRLSRARQHNLGATATPRSNIYENHEIDPGFVLRPGQLGIGHSLGDNLIPSMSNEQDFTDLGIFPPLDDILLDNIFFPHDSLLNGLMTGLEGGEQSVGF
ncbi:hypothetical protein S7711_02304 [Stachybotrys chartarum IBT 7711]|uniref:Zn(2)-C6 fungal-type domain-containing protein n=1 Tax=Stachybotrys chartarum (strain CBS 109288 / IBT 7711) TaxID=1280523 RepID=A0A084B0W4_STACB|nr:hypothetical protein S7711_02304 [Stachybotrys chartarum IBT 7711]